MYHGFKRITPTPKNNGSEGPCSLPPPAFDYSVSPGGGGGVNPVCVDSATPAILPIGT